MRQFLKPKPIPPGFGAFVAAIGLAANVFGLFCLYQALREGLGAYQYHASIPLLGVYKGALGLYVIARQRDQWLAPKAEASRQGHYFVLAWLALPVLLNALEVGRLWDPPPVQPAGLNGTLIWVLGLYVVGKVSALARSRGALPAGADVLRLGVDVLAALCLFDVLREAFIPPSQSFIHIHFAYRAALAVSVATNQCRKWLEREARPAHMGHLWLAEWLAAAVAIKGLSWFSADNLIVMPGHLAGTLLWVFSIYVLGLASDLARKKGPRPVGAAARPALSLPGLCALSAAFVFVALAVVSEWREVSLPYPPRSAGASSRPAASRDSAAVLPFEEMTAAKEPVRRGVGGKGSELVCELGAEANHLGRVDGRALARALARELARAGLFERVRYVERAGELKDETVLIRGRVLESALRILKGGDREYAVGVALLASRASPGGRRAQAPFWGRILRRRARAQGAPAVYEIGALVRALCADAAGGPGEAALKAGL